MRKILSNKESERLWLSRLARVATGVTAWLAEWTGEISGAGFGAFRARVLAAVIALLLFSFVGTTQVEAHENGLSSNSLAGASGIDLEQVAQHRTVWPNANANFPKLATQQPAVYQRLMSSAACRRGDPVGSSRSEWRSAGSS